MSFLHRHCRDGSDGPTASIGDGPTVTCRVRALISRRRSPRRLGDGRRLSVARTLVATRGTRRCEGNKTDQRCFFSGQAKGLFGSESVILECTNFSVGTAQAMQREAADNLINQDRATVKNDFRCLRRYFPFCYGRATSLCRSIAWTRRRR